MEVNAKLLALVLCVLQFYNTGTCKFNRLPDGLSIVMHAGAMKLLWNTPVYEELAMQFPITDL